MKNTTENTTVKNGSLLEAIAPTPSPKMKHDDALEVTVEDARENKRASKLFNRDGIDRNTVLRAVNALELETTDNKRDTLLEAVSDIPTTSLFMLSLAKKHGYDFSKSRDGVRVIRDDGDDVFTAVDSWKRSNGARMNLPLLPTEADRLLEAIGVTPYQYNKRATRADGTEAHRLENLSSSFKKYPTTAYIRFDDFDKVVTAVIAYLSDDDEALEALEA